MRTGLGKLESGPRSLCRGPADAPLVERLRSDGWHLGRTISNPARPAEGKLALTLLAGCLILHQLFLKRGHHRSPLPQKGISVLDGFLERISWKVFLESFLGRFSCKVFLNGFHHVRERQSVCRKIDPAEPTQLVMQSDGPRISTAHGHSGKGYTLDASIGAKLVAADHDECVCRARPVYTIAHIDDIYGRVVADERLMLPLPDGGAVTSAIASPRTIELAAQWTGTSNRRQQ
jgi:hypothetical protein